MNEIDFLPVAYRAKHAQRKTQPRLALTMAAIGLLIAAGIYGQYANRRYVANRLAVARGEYAAATAQTRRLGDLKTQLQAARAEADWLTYLRHPWPRTQIIAAILAPLPEAVNLGELHVLLEKPAAAVARAAPAPKAKPDNPAAAKPLPAEQDLARLREEVDSLQTVVVLSGVTDDNAALHRYLEQLGTTPLFAHVELTIVESASGASAGTSRFSARLTVRPGYGQPNGPQPVERTLAKNPHVKTAARAGRAAASTLRPVAPGADRLPASKPGFDTPPTAEGSRT